MYCRLQGYPSPLLISYKITGIRVLWGFGVPLCGLALNLLCSPVPLSHCWHIERDTPFTTTLKKMSTIQFFINGNQVEIQLDPILAILGQFSNIVTAPVNNAHLQDIEEFDAFMTAILKEYFSEQQSESIVSTLSEISQENYPDYRDGLGLYHMFVGSLEQRQLMKVVFATYALKFGRNHDNKTSLKSKIKYATACPHCGAYASAIRDRLVKEGYLTV